MAFEMLKGMNVAPAVAPSGPGSGLGAAKTGLDPGAAAEFKGALDQAVNGSGRAPATGDRPLETAGASPNLKFSTHAIERMRSRGISFEPQTMKSIEGAVRKAAAKGSKDTLVLAGDNALIVSVKNNTVVTVMDRAAMKENVFTNIDSTVVL